MKIAVITCYAYRDCWKPFVSLFRKFWPDCPHELWLVTDRNDRSIELPDVQVFEYDATWTEVLGAFASEQDESLMLCQEDFLFTAPVDANAIYRALDRLEHFQAGCVRLYPCPGAETDFGDPEFGAIAQGVPYRISCMAALWDPEYLTSICSDVGPGSAADFELKGSRESNTYANPILGWKRDVKPWCIQHLASAIGRGKWDPNAKKLCEEHGIEVDWTMREFA